MIIFLSDSKKIRWFQCPMCVYVKYVNNASFVDYLRLDDYVITAISNVCVLKSVPRDSRVSWAENLLDEMLDILHDGQFYFLAGFSDAFLVFS